MMMECDLSKIDILYRRADLTSDWESISNLWHDVYRETHAHLVPKDMLKHRTLKSFQTRARTPAFIENTILATTKSQTCTATGNYEKVVGFINSRMENCSIYQLFVAKEARKLGVGKELLRRAEDDIIFFQNNKVIDCDATNIAGSNKEHNYITIHLHASVGNFVAKNFYEKLGWKTIKEEILQAEIVTSSPDDVLGEKSRNMCRQRIEYFPLPCYRLEKRLFLQ